MVVKIVYLLASIALFSLVSGRNSEGDLLEWLPYDPHDIPPGAIPLHRTLDSKYIYPGRAYLTEGNKEGYIPVDIIEGKQCAYGVLDMDFVQVCDNITILNGKNDFLDNLFWHNARPSFFLTLFDSDEYKPVRVGWEVGADNNLPFNTSLYYARSYFAGRYWGTKIATSRPNQEIDNVGYMAYVDYYSDEPAVYSSYSYEVLMLRY